MIITRSQIEDAVSRFSASLDETAAWVSAGMPPE